MAGNKIRLDDPNVAVIEVQVAHTFTSDATKKDGFSWLIPRIGEENPRCSLTSWNYIGYDPEKFPPLLMAQEFLQPKARWNWNHRYAGDDQFRYGAQHVKIDVDQQRCRCSCPSLRLRERSSRKVARRS